MWNNDNEFLLLLSLILVSSIFLRGISYFSQSFDLNYLKYAVPISFVGVVSAVLLNLRATLILSLSSSLLALAGGGNIGFNLAKNIEQSFESARIKIIEKNKERAEFIANELNNSIIINGNGLDEDVLEEASLEEIETVLALTNDDENNMMACVLAEKTGLKKRTIAIVNKSNYNLLQDSLNIDDLVDPRMTTVSRIMEHVHKGTIGTVYSCLLYTSPSPRDKRQYRMPSSA